MSNKKIVLTSLIGGIILALNTLIIYQNNLLMLVPTFVIGFSVVGISLLASRLYKSHVGFIIGIFMLWVYNTMLVHFNYIPYMFQFFNPFFILTNSLFTATYLYFSSVIIAHFLGIK